MTTLHTYEELNKTFSYDLETGIIIRKVDRNWRAKAGDVVGSLTPKGYLTVFHDYKQYRLSRLAWFLHYKKWPVEYLDHINRDKTDNRIENLREATDAQNKANVGKKSTNTTGFKGVTQIRTGRYVAQIKIAGKGMHLGLYDTAKEAHVAYCNAADKEFGEFAHHG